ncbi:hypothetical protein [Rhodoferax sp. WC2427]|uniref:hypothetical protein n=1 Tax=Rhodoferax sp. WC2427 TaxID=3234144 RepID=UPI0034666852
MKRELHQLPFTALDRHQRMVSKIATIDPQRQKIILIQPRDRWLYASGLREKRLPGYLCIFAHATPHSVQGIADGAALAQLVRDSGVWHGEPILLDACHAGAILQGIASQLARALATPVTAATTPTWNFPLGGRAVGQGAFAKLPGVLGRLPIPHLLKPGTWRTWDAQGQWVAERACSPRKGGPRFGMV